MKSNLEVDVAQSLLTSSTAANVKRLPRSVRKYIRRQKASLRRRFELGPELAAALDALLNRFYYARPNTAQLHPQGDRPMGGATRMKGFVNKSVGARLPSPAAQAAGGQGADSLHIEPAQIPQPSGPGAGS